jgi:hypothetical protein
VTRGGARAPYYRVEGRVRRPNGVGNQEASGGAPLWPSGSVGRGNRGGEWGVKTGGECGGIFKRGGDAGVVRTLEAVAAAAFGWLRPGEEGSWVGPMWQ